VSLCRYQNWYNLRYGGALKFETLLPGDVNFRSTNEVGVLIIVSLLNASAHSCLYSGRWVLETLLHFDVNFHSTNEMEVLIIAGCIGDGRVVEYVLVLVLVLVSKLETLLHDCNTTWRRFSFGRSSVSASPMKHIPVERGSLYAASQVEQGLASFKV
jgi:hypothetical protein